MNNKNLELANLIEGFKLSCQTEGKSIKTIEWYTCFLTRFSRFLQSSGFPGDIRQIGKNHIKAFILYLQTEARVPHSEAQLSGASIQGYVRTLKALFSWLQSVHWLIS